MLSVHLSFLLVSAEICLSVLACHLLFASRGFPPSNRGLSTLIWSSFLLVMRKQLNCFVLLTSPYLPLFPCVNVRLTLCACIGKYTTVHLWKMFYMLASRQIFAMWKSSILHNRYAAVYFLGLIKWPFVKSSFENLKYMLFWLCGLYVAGAVSVPGLCVKLWYISSHCDLFNVRFLPKIVFKWGSKPVLII